MAVSIQVISHHPAESRPAYQARAVTSIFVRSQQRRFCKLISVESASSCCLGSTLNPADGLKAVILDGTDHSVETISQPGLDELI